MEFLSVFASVDKDEDLLIHEIDLDNYAAEMKYEKAFTTKWLRLFDNDKDGKISFTEFCETLGLDEKIYEEKLIEVRKKIAQRQLQPQEKSPANAESDRASRRVNRLPRQQPTAQRPTAAIEVKENVEPPLQPTRRFRVAQPPPVQEQSVEKDEAIQEEAIQPKTTLKARAGISSDNSNEKASAEEVTLEFGDDDARSIQVEFSDMEPKDLDTAKSVLAKLASQSRTSTEVSGEFDRRMMHELDKALGDTWQCQSNPELSPKEVNYIDGSMAVLIAKPERRVMLWRAQKTGGMCCCS